MLYTVIGNHNNDGDIMSKRHSDSYQDERDKTVLIRKSDKQNWYWCHPSDGDVHGSTTTDYVVFDNIGDATRTANRYGYKVIFD